MFYLLKKHKLVSNITIKPDYFNNFFSLYPHQITTVRTQEILHDRSLIHFTLIIMIINTIIMSLDTCKAHQHNYVSIKMLKTCDLFIIHTYLAIIGAIKGTSQTKIHNKFTFRISKMYTMVQKPMFALQNQKN